MVSKRQQDTAFARAKSILDKVDDDLTPDASLYPVEESDEKQEQEAKEEELIDAALQGAGEKTVSIFKHEVRFKLLNVREELQAAALCKPAEGTKSYTLSLATAYFALSCLSIDSIPFFTSIASDGSEAAQRWQIALRYYTPFINKFFEQYTSFRIEQEKKLEELGK